MSVRKVYNVTVDGVTVYSGSYRTALTVYQAFDTYISTFPKSDSRPYVCVAFQPDLKDLGFKDRNLEEGGILDG